MQVSSHSPKLVITSINTFWDSKEAKEADTAREEFSRLKALRGDDVEIGVSTFNEPFGGKLKRIGKKLLKPTLGVAIGAGLLAAAAVTGGLLTVPMAIGAASLAATTVPVTALGAVVKKHALRSASDVPTGTAIQSTQNKPLELAHEEELDTPAEIAREVIVSQMKRFPGAVHVAHFNGHGHGNKTVGGLPAMNAKEALTEAVKRGGKKFEIALYESCYGANFEFLHGQSKVADYALAMEDEVPKSNTVTGRLPLGGLFDLNYEASDARTAVQMMTQKAGRHFDNGEEIELSNVPHEERHLRKNRDAKWRNMDTTISAIDLEKLENGLAPKLNDLGELLKATRREHDSFGYAVDQARRNNTIDRTGDLVDMGGFLRDLRDDAIESLPELRVALDSTLEQLDEVVVCSRTSQGQPLSGLSFHTKPKTRGLATLGTDAHADPHLPRGWVDFVKEAL